MQLRRLPRARARGRQHRRAGRQRSSSRRRSAATPATTQLYGFPQEFNIEYGATLVNTDLAAAAGVSTDGWDTWDEFAADAQKLTVLNGDAMTRAGYHFTAADGMSYTFFSLLTQAGGSMLNEDGTAFTLEHARGQGSVGADEGARRPRRGRPGALQRHRELGRRLLLRDELRDGAGRPVGRPRVQRRLPRRRRGHHLRAAARPGRLERVRRRLRLGPDRGAGQPRGGDGMGLHRVRHERRRERARMEPGDRDAPRPEGERRPRRPRSS